MTGRPAAGHGPIRGRPLRRRILEALRFVPAGRVTTFDALASYLEASSVEVTATLSRLTEDERQAAPWHRAVAKGGAIGRGPWRERQFALLAREGVSLSPAGIVQDLPRTVLLELDPSNPAPVRPSTTPPSAAGSRSRGMRERPGG